MSDPQSIIPNQLVAADSSGVPKWSIPAADFTPQYVNSDGNLVAASASSGALFTFDNGGNVIAQAPDTGDVFSWTNQWYSPSGMSAVAMPPLQWNLSFEAFSQGNRSSNGTP